MEPVISNIWKHLSRIFPAGPSETQLAAQLFREYESESVIKRPAAQLIGLELPVVADFFRRVSLMHSAESPVTRRRDTRWMSEFDYTMVNVRAAGTSGRPGTFLSASVFLTTLGTQGIILAPLTKGHSEDLRQLESHAAVRDELADTTALEAGISTEHQLKAFCEAAHMLGLVLGFELDYRVHPAAAVVAQRPELFFWTRGGRFEPDEAVQDQIREDIRTSVQNGRTDWNRADTAPLGSADGSGRTALALRMAVPDGSGAHREAAVTYWSRVFDIWRDRCGFDFLVLRGTGQNHPESPGLSLMSKAANAARKAGVRRSIGVAAEGHPFEAEQFGIQGIDLVIEDNAEERAGQKWFEKTFELNSRLSLVNRGRKLRFSAPLMVSPGEKDSLPRRERALIKRFTARFLGSGPSRRPILETMGAAEEAWGFNTSVRQNIPMGWQSAPSPAAVCIDSVARQYKGILESGELADSGISEQLAWWVIRARKGMLIAMVSVENDAMLPPGRVCIDYAPYQNEAKVIQEYDFQDERGMLQLCSGTLIETTLNYRSFRLCAVI